MLYFSSQASYLFADLRLGEIMLYKNALKADLQITKKITKMTLVHTNAAISRVHKSSSGVKKSCFK